MVEVEAGARFRARTPKALFPVPYSRNFYYDTAADGKRFLMTKPTPAREASLEGAGGDGNQLV